MNEYKKINSFFLVSILLMSSFLMFVPIPVLADDSIQIFSDDFDDNILDTTKWTEYVTLGSSFSEINQEAIFTTNNGFSLIYSQVLNISNWYEINITGKWKFTNPNTAEMRLFFMDSDTNVSVGVVYATWTTFPHQHIRYYNGSGGFEEYLRTVSTTYVDFKLILTNDKMQYWENGVEINEIDSTALSETTRFKIQIGGYDASSGNQYIYFDDIQINVGDTSRKSKFFSGISSENETFLDNQIYQRSIIGSVMEKRYVLPVATLISIILLFLLNLLIEFLSDYSSEKTLDYRQKKKAGSVKKMTKTIQPHKYLTKREIFSVFFTATILSLVLTWTWVPDLSLFWELFVITIIPVFCIFLFRESLRSYLCHKKQIGSEFYIWPIGSIMMVVSTIIGNTFSLAANHNYDDEQSVKSCGGITFIVSLVMYLIIAASLLINFLYPSIVIQMIVIVTVLNLFIDLFPFRPMDGYEIKHWNILIWAGLYVVVIVTYIIIYFDIFP